MTDDQNEVVAPDCTFSRIFLHCTEYDILQHQWTPVDIRYSSSVDAAECKIWNPIGPAHHAYRVPAYSFALLWFVI